MKKTCIYTCRVLRGIIMSAFCVLLWGCSDDSYLYTNGTNFYSVPMEVRAKVAILSDVKASSDTAVKRQINVYAFRKSSNGDYRVTSKDNPKYCLLDGSIEPTPSAGRTAYVQNGFEYVEWKYNDPATYYPNGTDHLKTYDFFAFGAGNDNTLEEIRYKDSVVVFFAVNGTQDVITSIGECEPDIDPGLKPYLFSYYTATRDRHPVFEFTHHCVKLSFAISPGKTPPSRKYIVVDSISIVSRANCHLVAVCNDSTKIGANFLGDKADKEFFVRNADGGTYLNLVFQTLIDDFTEVEPLYLDGLYVSPESSYAINFYMKEAPLLEEAMAKKSQKTSDLVMLSREQCFLTGYQYTIKTTVSGVNNVYVTGELTDWKEGEDLSIVSGDDEW